MMRSTIRAVPRDQGRRYFMSHLLLFTVLAVLAGATSYQSNITVMTVHRESLNAAFEARFRRAPAGNTLRNLFVALDPDALEGAFRRHARHLDGTATPDGTRTIALDGKTLCGSFDHLHDRTTVHVLSAFASDAALILAHREVACGWACKPSHGPETPTELILFKYLIQKEAFCQYCVVRAGCLLKAAVDGFRRAVGWHGRWQVCPMGCGSAIT